ncbi:MAG: YceI family protein [bacterium]
MKGFLVAVLAAVSLVPLGAFGLDADASRLEFAVRDNRGGFTGVAREIEARAVVREQGESFAADVDLRVDARRITTGIGLRDGQMRRDFLQTDRFPFIVFRGTAVPRDRPGALPFAVGLRGALTIKDVTREVEIPMRVTALADAYLAEGQVVLRLSEYGIPIPRMFIFVAEDPVTVTFKIRLVPK